MHTVRPAAEHLRGLEPYDPRYLPARISLNANENPYGMPEAAREALKAALDAEPLYRYPDPLGTQLCTALADRLGVPRACVVLGNGGDELLFNLCLAYGGAGRTVLTAPPTFSAYHTNAVLTRTELLEVFRASDASPEGLLDFRVHEEAILQQLHESNPNLVVLTSPNNPTGDCLTLSFIQELLDATDAVVLVDQAYVEFAHPGYDATMLLKDNANLALLRTFSKAYGLAGLRIGYCVASEEIAGELRKVRQPYSVDTLAAVAAMAALGAEAEVQSVVARITVERERVAKALGMLGLGLPVAPSEANYLLFRVPAAHEVWQKLYESYSILVRDLSLMPGLASCLRVSIGTPEENDEFLAALAQIL
ncbi:MAG: histidinol-phosphate transaminase [Coriobacteriales bacterium]|jgi:histidinol-phosphate aminotransferase|nr:histidinol-phosphate transaminase [Coriobacteriales bacterium]